MKPDDVYSGQGISGKSLALIFLPSTDFVKPFSRNNFRFDELISVAYHSVPYEVF